MKNNLEFMDLKRKIGEELKKNFYTDYGLNNPDLRKFYDRMKDDVDYQKRMLELPKEECIQLVAKEVGIAPNLVIANIILIENIIEFYAATDIGCLRNHLEKLHTHKDDPYTDEDVAQRINFRLKQYEARGRNPTFLETIWDWFEWHFAPIRDTHTLKKVETPETSDSNRLRNDEYVDLGKSSFSQTQGPVVKPPSNKAASPLVVNSATSTWLPAKRAGVTTRQPNNVTNATVEFRAKFPNTISAQPSTTGEPKRFIPKGGH